MRMVPLQAFFVTQYYRPELVGSAPFCADLAEWLAKQGRRVTVLTGLPHYPTAEMFPDYRVDAPKREVFCGVSVERCRVWIPRRRSAPWRILGEVLFFLGGAWALAARRITLQPFVLSLCPSILSVALGALARRPDGRHVAIVHDIQSGLAGGLGMVGSAWLLRLMRWCERLVLNRVDLIAVLTDEMKEQLRSIGVSTPIEVVPIWVDTTKISPVASVGDRPLRLLYSGNFGKKQGLGQIIALAEELRQRDSDIEIVLRGSGSQLSALRSEIAARDLRNVRRAELLLQEQFAQGLAEGDIHLVPQDPDAAEFAVPSKIFNVMAAGRPFVTTARPGSPLWRLQQRSGAFLCVPPNDARAFADAVMQLAGNEQLRVELGARGRHFVEQYCSKSKVLSEFMTLIDGLYATR